LRARAQVAAQQMEQPAGQLRRSAGPSM
jgi:hypothetical protein